jgi:predicted GNAT family N-acyltransferase
MSQRVVEVDYDSSGHSDAVAVRREVFVEGQGVPESLEVDDHEPACRHFVAYDGETPVGAARLRPLDATTAKVERVSVLESFRGEGWGDRLMDAVEAAAREAGVDRLVLHAQTPVEAFYERRGYRTTSDVFEEAGIPHVEMERRP